MKFLSNLPNRSSNDSSIGVKLLGISKPALSALVAARLMVCTVTVVAKLSALPWSWGEGIRLK